MRTEGGSASLTFTKRCSSSEEVQRIQGALAGTLRCLVSIEGRVRVDFDEQERNTMDSTTVSFFGDYALESPINNFEQAIGEAYAMTQKLSTATNTLKVKLLPVSFLDRQETRICRDIANSTLEGCLTNLRKLGDIELGLKELCLGATDIFEKPCFVHVRKEFDKFCANFKVAVLNYKQTVCGLLPQLKGSGTDEHDEKLRKAVHLSGVLREVGDLFLEKKSRYIKDLQSWIQRLSGPLISGDFTLNNFLSEMPSGYSSPVIVFSLGKTISPDYKATFDMNDFVDDEDEDTMQQEEWFEDAEKLRSMNDSLTLLIKMGTNNTIHGFDAVYGFGVITTVNVGGGRKTAGKIGSVYMITNEIKDIDWPVVPTEVSVSNLHPQQSNIRVSWRGAPNAISYKVIFVRALDSNGMDLPSSDESFLVVNECHFETDHLLPHRDYTIKICSQTSCGYSDWTEKSFRTDGPPSLVSILHTFFDSHREELVRTTSTNIRGALGYRRPWQKVGSTLYLGLQCSAVRMAANGTVLFDIMDVIGEYSSLIPHTASPTTTSPDKELVILFIGKTGAGKSTHINAFLNWIFGIQFEDSKRVILIDDRNIDQSGSVTAHISMYKIPLVPGMKCDRPLLLIDTPGWGDTRGLQYDNLITDMLKQLSENVDHINAVAFVMKASDQRFDATTAHVVFSALSHIAQDMTPNLLAVLTQADRGNPPALNSSAMREIFKIPLQSAIPDRCYVKVNNAAFLTIEPSGDKVMDQIYWQLTMQGLASFASKCNSFPSTSILKTQQVIANTLSFRRHLDVLDEIMRSILDAENQIIAQLSSLAVATGTAPTEKVKVQVGKTEKVQLEPGVYVTLCNICNVTCHWPCSLDSTSSKERCSAMGRDGKCRNCSGKCDWSQHRNDSFRWHSSVEEIFMLPRELVEHCGENCRSIEEATLVLIDSFFEKHGLLLSHLEEMLSVQNELREAAQYQPKKLVDYIDTLMNNESSPTIIGQLNIAKRQLLQQQELGRGQDAATLNAEILDALRRELQRRVQLNSVQVAEEEDNGSKFFNEVLRTVPAELRSQTGCPRPLKDRTIPGFITSTVKMPKYSENLRAMIVLFKHLLTSTPVFRNHSPQNIWYVIL